MDKKKKEKEINYESKFKNSINDYNQLNKETNARVFGVSSDFLEKNKKDFDEVRNIISRVNDKNMKTTGKGMIEFFNATVAQDKANNVKKNKNSHPVNVENNFKNTLESASQISLLNEMFFNEQERIKNYNEYELISYYIPIVSQGLEAIADAIVSPDDYSKKIFNFNYINEFDELNNVSRKVFTNIETLEDIYKIEEYAKDWIYETLEKGDKFVAVLKYKKEFDNILTEDTSLINESIIISESNLIINEEEDKLLKEIFLSEGSDNIKNYNYKKDIVDMINENLIFSTNSTLLYESDKIINNDFTSAVETNMASFDKIKNNVLKKDNNSTIKIDDKLEKEIVKNLNKSNKDLGNMKNGDVPLSVNGSYIKELNPENVVKIQSGSTVFGYYYAETMDENIKSSVTNAGRRHTQLQLKRNVEFVDTESGLTNPKTKLIVDIFTRAISSKLNKKFIENNKEFKKVIYELISKDYLVNKKVRINFLNANEVVHFMVKEDKDGYGVSELKKIAFVSKLYLAVLLSNLMMKLSRSVDHRAFYVETGLSQDVENVIQAFIRDIKTKEVTLNDVQTIDTIFKRIGLFHDYFIPVKNGERPVDFEIISGQDVQMDNDLLEYLKKAIISGMNVPSSYINTLEEVDFSRSIAMQNTKFLRNTVVKQKKLNKEFTKLYRILYMNEFEDELTQENNSVNVNSITVSFPSPATLNMTNLSDQIGTTDSVIQFITDVMAGESSDQSTKENIRRLLAKDMLPMIEWEKYEEILKNSDISSIEKKLLNQTDENSDDINY